MAWTQQGNIRGPQGIQGPPGPPGEAGTGIQIAGSVATYGDLPGGLGAGDAGDGYLVQADGLLYIWDGTQFPADGTGVQFKGPKGDDGAQGPAGHGWTGGSYNPATGIVTFTSNDGLGFVTGDLRGADGAQGAPGATGAPGANGTKWYTGSGAPSTIPGAAAGDLYLDVDDGTVYVLS